MLRRKLRTGLLLLCAAAALGCQTTESTFKASENNGHERERDFEQEPTTMGLSSGVEIPETDDESVDESALVPEAGALVLQDVETGTLWNLRGEAFRGELAGLRLEQLPAFNSFWFAWSAFYHGSEIWNRDITNETAPIEGEDSCEVPCDEIRLGCSGGKGCIPALDSDADGDGDRVSMVAADSGELSYLADDHFVLGVVIDGEARAYPHNVLWWHEIVNDTVGARELAVTFCPLTGSGLVFAGRHDGKSADFGVSGRLFNSNLVMFDRRTDTFWSQMMREGITGPQRGDTLELLPVVETTWGRWKKMYPGTKAVSSKTGFSRNYKSYPYGDYRVDHNDTFRPTNPDYQDTYSAKDRVLGLVGDGMSRAYAFPEIEKIGDRVVINDDFDDGPIVVVYEARDRMAIPFSATVDGRELSFRGVRLQ